MTRLMNRHASAALLLAVAVAGCSGYDQNAVQSITAPLPGSFIRFANFSVSAPSVNFYANDIKMTAVGTTACSPPPTVPNPACTGAGVESTTGTAAGAYATSSVGLYSAIAPGAYTLSGRIAAATDKGLQISKASTTIENGKYYTYYQSGIYDAAGKTSESFIVEDQIPARDYTLAFVRLVNAVSTSQPVILYAKDQLTGTEVAIGGTIAYKGAGAFVTLPTGIYDLSTRLPGSATSIITRLGVTFAAGRVYTVTERAATTTTLALDNTTNR